MEKKYIIKGVLNSSVLSLNSYGNYSLVCISDIYCDAQKIKFFDSKEEAEKYILQNNIKPATIEEIFM